MHGIAFALALAVLAVPLRASCPLRAFDGPPVHAAGTILTVADFNADGRPDILSGRYEDSTLHLALGTSGGALRRLPPIAIHTQLDRLPVAFDAVTGDFNEDGLLDFALTAMSPGSIQVHLGHGNGTFAPARVINYQWEPRAIATADLDDDGHLDLVAMDLGGPVDLFWGRGDGTFSMPTSIPLDARGADVAIADFNEDGRPDLLLGRVDLVTEVRLSNGDRTFRAPQQLVASGGRYGMVARDVNGDGHLDVAIADLGDFLVSIFPGRGDGTFGTRVDYSAGEFTEGIAFGELTGDAFPDIVAGNAVLGTVVILPGVGRGLFGPPTSLHAGSNIWGVFVADITGDGLDDILASDLSSYTVLAQDADHTFEQREVFPLNDISFDITSADFNADGTPDLAVAAFASGMAELFISTPRKGLVSAIPVLVGPDPVTLDAVDMNADGKMDLVAGIRGGVSVSLGRGDGRFVAPDITQLADIRYVTAVGDFDNDGDPDVLALDRMANRIELLANDGTGRLSNNAREVRISRVPAYALLVDVNDDGKNDLVVAEDPALNESKTPGFLTIRLGNGNGTFGAPREHPAGTAPSDISAADLDGDGAIDLAVADFSFLGGAVRLYKGSASGSFAEAATLIGYGQAEETILHDLDNDGDADVAFSNAGLVYVYENLGGFTFAEPLAHTAGDSPRSLTIADFNRDGRPDIATAGTGGEVSIQWNESACRRRAARQ